LHQPNKFRNSKLGRGIPAEEDGAKAAGPAELRNDRRFQLAVAVLHLLEHLRQLLQRDFAGDEIAGADFAARHRVERLADKPRRVVKRGFDRDFRVVQRGRVESLNLSTAAAAVLYEAVRQRSARL